MVATTSKTQHTNTKPAYELFDENTQALIYNFQPKAVQRMLDFDIACGRSTPSVAGIIHAPKAGSQHACFWGSKDHFIPIYATVEDATRAQPQADAFVNFASFRSAFESSREALLQPTIRTVSVIAEGMPERRARELLALAKQHDKWIIGPATVGGVKAGKFKIGNTAGTLDNISESKLYSPGFVGFVSKSGGMSNEMYNTISMACCPENAQGDRHAAINEGIAIGGDSFPGSTLLEHLLRFEANPDIKMLVALGEVGGVSEYEVVEALKDKRITKPLVMWCIGTCTRLFPGEVQFGHAGARADDETETAYAKNEALQNAGAIVPESFDAFGDTIATAYRALVEQGKIKPVAAPDAVVVPIDVNEAHKQGLVRKSTNIVSTISDDRGEELTYNGVEISRVVSENYGIGGTLGLLWFKRDLPTFARDYLELILVLTADHGPAVSGAHNTIVSARAGKDLVSSVASGMLTIGPRFGGAIDAAADYFKKACDQGVTPIDFVAEMKAQSTPIPGIGHRVKSVQNPDKRVELLKDFAFKHFGDCKYLNYALEVESITTKKKKNLILNVDGAIGVSFIDMLHATGLFSEDEILRFIDLKFLNGLFVVSRCIGMVGHYMDQNVLSQALYRHPWDDITYLTK